MLDFAEKVKLHNVNFNLVPELWESFCCEGIDLDSIAWSETKFLSDDGNALNEGMRNLPDNMGGIYLFYVKCNVLAGISNYLMYIGKANITEQNSLRVRCRKYFYEYSDEDGRPKIKRLVKQWGNYLYLKYIGLDDNYLIDRLETSLINCILPPFNDFIPEKRIRDAVKAFN